MGFATRCAAVEAVDNAIYRTPSHVPSFTLGKQISASEKPATSSASSRPASSSALPPTDFAAFSDTLRRDFGMASSLERVLVDRLILAAWRLHRLSLDELDSVSEDGALPPLSRETLRAERSLETALDLLETSRVIRKSRWGRVAQSPSVVTPISAEFDQDEEETFLSNEWPIVPDRFDFISEVEDAEQEEIEPSIEVEETPRWQDRLIFDPNVSETSPVVRGTWVTVSHVVSLVVDGWTWSEILRTHPEITEDDVRTCLAYSVEQDTCGEY